MTPDLLLANLRTASACNLVVTHDMVDDVAAAFRTAEAETEARVRAAEREAAVGIIASRHEGHGSWEWCDCEEMIAAIRARGDS